MKKVKRDRNQRAYTRGYNVGLEGRSKELCPFSETSARQSWLMGWRDGREDLWAGYSGVSGLQKANIIHHTLHT